MPRAAISEADLKMWQARMAHADEVWKEKGLLGDEPGTPGNESLQRILGYYRGVHWDYDWAGLDDSERATVNSIFETANTLMAQVAARAPRVQLFPESPPAVQFVRASEELYNYYVKELDMQRQVNAALMESFFSPLGGIVRHGFTTRDDYYDDKGNAIHAYRDAKPDTPWIRHVHSWDFRCDTTKGSFHPSEVDWCAFRSLMTVDQIKATPGMRAPSSLSPTVSLRAEKLTPRELKALRDDDFTSLVEVWSIYDSRKEEWFQWSPGAPDTLLRDPAPWPLPWDELPYDVIAINQQPGDPFQRPYMAEVAPIHRERNRVRTMMSRLTRDLRRLVPVQENGLADGMYARLFDGVGPDLVEFILCKGPVRDVIGNVQIGGFPQELLLYDRMLEEDIRQITGQSRMDRGQRINVETAQEAFGVQQGSDTSKGRNQAANERLWKGVIRKFGQGLQAVMDEERIIPIVGVRDAQSLASMQNQGETFTRVPAEAIKQDYLFEIAVGSTLPRNDAQEQREAIALLEVASKFPQNANIQNRLIDVALAFDKDPTEFLIDQQTRDGMNELAEQQGGDRGETPPTVSPVAVLGGGGGG
jgi:hypothetical protein